MRGRYATVKGQRGVLVAGTRYRLDNPAVAKYINPASAAKEAVNLRGAGGVTALLVTTQDLLAAFANGQNPVSWNFIGNTGVDVAESLAVGAVGQMVGATIVGAGLLGGAPLAGTVVAVGISSVVGARLDRLEEWVKVHLFNDGSTQ